MPFQFFSTNLNHSQILKTRGGKKVPYIAYIKKQNMLMEQPKEDSIE